ncbi:MAG: hypothetical protein HYZ75_01535 [Elusimicrobia bacterium]|nr:hypothetical protein [Elusimicrobiota bacterium]
MGRATILGLLSWAAAAGADAPPTAPPAALDATVAEGRRTQSELTRLLDQLESLRRGYSWEKDGDRAGKRREELRAAITARAADMRGHHDAATRSLGRYAEEHGLQALEAFSNGMSKESPPHLIAAMRAQTFTHQATLFLRGIDDQLRREELDWSAFKNLDRERDSFRRTIWTLSLALLAVLAGVAYAAAAALARRRRRGKEIINIRPE